MKHSGLSRAIVAIAMMLIGWLPSLAHDFEVDGIFYNKTSDNTVAVTYKGDSDISYSNEYAGDVVIPSSANYNGTTYSVTSIGDEAFRSCASLTSIEIGNSVTSIGDYAFSSCSSLTSIEIPNSVTSIGNSAFYGCDGLTSIVVDAGNSKYDSRNDCNAIIETVSNTLVVGCQNTIIPNSVTSIREYAFHGCSSLTNVEIPNSVTSIGKSAFSSCSSLTSIEIPNSVTSIGNSAFYGCDGLTSIVVDAGNSKYDSRNDCNAIIETVSNTLVVGCQNTIIPNSVTSIGEKAFSSCESLTNIQIPNSVTSIGDGAFEFCSSLISIEIPNSVTSIENAAFKGCPRLKSIIIGSGVTSIGLQTFEFCYSLTDIIIGKNVRSIGDGSFRMCDRYTEITCLATTPPMMTAVTTFTNYSADLYVPAGCKEAYEAAEYWNKFTNIIELEPELEEGATFEYEGLTYKVVVKGEELAVIASENGKYSGDIVIPSSVDYNGATYSVTSIGKESFYDCSSLTSIQIPNSVTSIGDNVFYYCTSLTSIEIPNSVTSIGTEAFQLCSKLTNIEIPNSVTSIGKYAFRSCTSLTSIVVDAGNSKYDSRNGCNAIIETASNTLIAGCQNTIIPNSVTSIGDSAFSWCTSLTSIRIPNSVTSIGTGAFEHCSSLTSIVVDSGNTKYDSRNGCNAIIETASNTLIAGCQNTIIPNSVTSIGDSAFSWCTSLTSIRIPNSVTSIGNYAFANCDGLTSIEIPNSVTSIGNFAFYWCYSLTSIEIPNSVTSIGNFAFRYCSNLTSIEIGKSVTSIGDSAFYGCKRLTSIEIPNSVTSIGDGAFSHCTSLTSIEIPNSVTSIGKYAFQSCTSLTSIEIPNSVTSIGNDAFEHCSGLTNIEIPNSVTSIGDWAFQSCTSLTSIEIPNSVTSIGTGAFNGCTSLIKITCLAITPPTIKSSTFSNHNADLYVPAGCKESYEAAEYWNKFTNIIEIEEPNVILFIDDFAINAGETKELAINLTNEIAFTGFQADLYLPDGLEIEQEDGDYIFELTDRKGSDHVITSGKQANGAIRILCFSANLNEFSGSEGAVVKFRVTAANDFVGNYEISIKDIILAQTDESEYQLPATTTKVEARMLAKSITLDQTEVRLEATQTTTLLAIILPDNTSVKTVVWTSSDEAVAVVDENGVVTAIAIGEATITATTTDGTNLSASCKVTVVPTLGDANNDAVINVTDIMVVASYILGNTPEGFVFEAADVTKDGKINIIDIVAIANIILSSETPDETQLAARVARQTALGSRLFIDDTSIQEGETTQLAVNLTNDIAFSGFQADVKLPEGLELCQEDGEYMISLSDRKGNDHVLTSAMLPDGTIRILSYSMNLNDFAGADGALVYLIVKATQHFVGDYEISIDNITFTQADLTEYLLEPTVCRIAGTVGIEGIEAEQEAEYFNLQGLPVANPEKGGLYIIKRGDKVSKSVIK